MKYIGMYSFLSYSQIRQRNCLLDFFKVGELWKISYEMYYLWKESIPLIYDFAQTWFIILHDGRNMSKVRFLCLPQKFKTTQEELWKIAFKIKLPLERYHLQGKQAPYLWFCTNLVYYIAWRKEHEQT